MLKRIKILAFILILFSFCFLSCKKYGNDPISFRTRNKRLEGVWGTFQRTNFNETDLNSEYIFISSSSIDWKRYYGQPNNITLIYEKGSYTIDDESIDINWFGKANEEWIIKSLQYQDIELYKQASYSQAEETWKLKRK